MRLPQLCKHSLALQGPVQGILLQICLSHIPFFFCVFTQTTSASKCRRSLQSFPLHCAASEEPQRFQGDYIFFFFFFNITPFSSLLRDIFNAFTILKGLLERKVQGDAFRSRW